MKLKFSPAPRPDSVSVEDWSSWSWQMQNSMKNRAEFGAHLTTLGMNLRQDESEAFDKGREIFQVRSTPYYMSLLGASEHDPLRRIVLPRMEELMDAEMTEADPLGEKKNSPAPRIIHRYPDRILFLVTDFCSVYCRYCTRKHFTGQDQIMSSKTEYEQALDYIRSRTGVREVILSGGDPLTMGDRHLEKILKDLREIEHIEIIRIGTRMPVVCPMRVTPELTRILKAAKPVFLMTHFNHPRELTAEAAQALEAFVDNGIPVMNQMVLLNGVNNHPAIIQALSRRLLFLRVKPYYMFQCDPSPGTAHLRTSVDESLRIQRELWGVLSGLAMPTYALDIPNGGGKSVLTPNFMVSESAEKRVYRGWDGVEGTYINPPASTHLLPLDWEDYQSEWEATKSAKS